MTNLSDPLDFEFEELIQIPPTTSKRKKKVIGLDDLVEDYYKEQKRINEDSKRAKFKKNCDSDEDEDEDANEAELSKCVDDCHDKMGQIGGDDGMPLWGLQLFNHEITLPQLVSPELRSCGFLQSFLSHELNFLVQLQAEEGETFLEELLIDGWLSVIVQTHKKIEKSIATWTYDLMFYSTRDVLSTAAFNLWNAMLSLNNEKTQIDFLPGYSDLRRALEIYGFLLDSPDRFTSDMDMVYADSNVAGPPGNIRVWIKFVSVYCQARAAHGILSTSEVEDILFIVICLFLDRKLLALSEILYQCLNSAMSFFKDDEWRSSSEKVAKSLACRLPKDINCLRAIECISGVDARFKQLRSKVAFEFLVSSFGNQAFAPEEILRLLMSINVRGKNCDLLQMYIYISLAENWLLCNSAMKDNPIINEMWAVCLRNCSCQITSTDLRSYASKLRSKASYLLQGVGTK